MNVQQTLTSCWKALSSWSTGPAGSFLTIGRTDFLSRRSSISFEQALTVFDHLADRDDLAFGYLSEGCQVRAHLVCMEMKTIGLKPRKAWAFRGENPLYVMLPDGKKGEWDYHVVLALPVRMPKGKILDLVFDPGLFDGPVTLQEWGHMIDAPAYTLQVTEFGQAPSGCRGDYSPATTTAEALAPDHPEYPPLRIAIQQMKQIVSRTVFPSHFCHVQHSKDSSGVGRRGRNWSSEGVHLMAPGQPSPSLIFMSRQRSSLRAVRLSNRL